MTLRHFLFRAGVFILAGSSFLLPQASEALLASTKNGGLANTGAALPLDSMAAAYNPAGMVEVGTRLDLADTWVEYSGGADICGNLNPLVNGHFNGYKTKNYYPPSLGANYSFNCDTMSVGLTVYEKDFNRSKYSKPFVILGKSPAGLEYIHYTIAPTFAFKLGSCHSFGVSLNAEVQRLKVHGIENFANSLFSSDPKHVTDQGADYSWGFSATFGWLWNITDGLKFGLVYQTPCWMQKFDKYRGFIAEHGEFNPPYNVTAGLAWSPMCDLTIAFDVQYTHWKSIRALKNPLLPNLFISDLGDKNGVGFGWKNQIFYRVGIEYDFNECFTVRAGFRHVNTPIRKEETVTNQLTLNCVENFATVGATYYMDECNDFTFFYGHGFNHKIKGKNSIPMAFGGGEVDINQQINAFGLSWGLIF